jgi:hypothetical protein
MIFSVHNKYKVIETYSLKLLNNFFDNILVNN